MSGGFSAASDFYIFNKPVLFKRDQTLFFFKRDQTSFLTFKNGYVYLYSDI